MVIKRISRIFRSDKTLLKIFETNLEKKLVDKDDYRLYLSIRSNDALSRQMALTQIAISILLSIYPLYLILLQLKALDDNNLTRVMFAAVIIVGGLFFMYLGNSLSNELLTTEKEFGKYFLWKSNAATVKKGNQHS